jgi:transcriptional regulator with XRE-family HTH domain
MVITVVTMSPRRSGSALLAAFRKRHDISARAAARSLGVTHVALAHWESGNQTPSQPFREAIETWTNGDVPAASWPLGERETALLGRAAQVEPFKPSAA